MKKEEEKVKLTKFLKGEPVNKFVQSLFYQEVSKSCSGRAGQLAKALNQSVIKVGYVRSMAFRGVPNECVGLRGIVWRILLDYLPKEAASWESFLDSKKLEYDSYCKSMKIPSVTHSLDKGVNTLSPDQELAKEIKTDIKRTKRDMPFFGLLAHGTEEGKCPEEKEEEDFTYDNRMTHRLVLSQILYIFAKKNEGMGYIQGMNELLSVIYYCFFHFSVPELRPYVESDTFFCFSNLMAEMKDPYSREMDKTEVGIQGVIKKINDIFKRVDFEYWEYLAKCKADIQLFALRWIMLLFAQDLEMEQVMRLWDTLLGDEKRFLFFRYLVVQIILEAKESVIGSEFYEFVKAIQRVPKEMDLLETLKKAATVRLQSGV